MVMIHLIFLKKQNGLAMFYAFQLFLNEYTFISDVYHAMFFLKISAQTYNPDICKRSLKYLIKQSLD